MKIKTAKRIIIVGIMSILIMLGYLCGFWTENKIAFSNSENEISAEEDNLTEEIVDDTIIMEEEIAEPIEEDEICLNKSESENENPISDSDEDSETEGRTHREIIEETLIQEVNVCKCIDAYEEGNWYCYYVYADGDIYVITLKNDRVDVCCQLN